MELFKEKRQQIRTQFRQAELNASQYALVRAWDNFGEASAQHLEINQVKSLLKRAKLAIQYQYNYNDNLNDDFKRLLIEENYFLQSSQGLKNPTNPNQIVYASGWLRMHWQIYDLYMEQEGLKPIDTPKEIDLPQTIPLDYINFHQIHHVEAFRRRKAIRTALDGLAVIQRHPEFISSEHFR